MTTASPDTVVDHDIEAASARKPWVVPVVEVHDVEALTMVNGGLGGDGPFSSAT